MGIPTIEPPAYSDPHSVAEVAREEALFAICKTLEETCDACRRSPLKASKFSAHTAHIILTAASASASTSAPLSYVAFLAAATAIEGIGDLGIVFARGGFPEDGRLQERRRMVLDTAVVITVAATDGFDSSKASPVESNWNQQGPRQPSVFFRASPSFRMSTFRGPSVPIWICLHLSTPRPRAETDRIIHNIWPSNSLFPTSCSSLSSLGTGTRQTWPPPQHAASQ